MRKPVEKLRGRVNMMVAFMGQPADMRRVCDCAIAAAIC
jgi:hypothetical protein